MANEARAQQPVIAAGLVPEGLSRGRARWGIGMVLVVIPAEAGIQKKSLARQAYHFLISQFFCGIPGSHMVDSAGMIRMEWEVPSKTDIESSQE